MAPDFSCGQASDRVSQGVVWPRQVCLTVRCNSGRRRGLSRGLSSPSVHVLAEHRPVEFVCVVLRTTQEVQHHKHCMPGPWTALQVRRDACQALAILAASLQFRTLPALNDGSPAAAAAQPELVLTPAVELLIAHKPAVLQVSTRPQACTEV
jgi:hypothetical protein